MKSCFWKFCTILDVLYYFIPVSIEINRCSRWNRTRVGDNEIPPRAQGLDRVSSYIVDCEYCPLSGITLSHTRARNNDCNYFKGWGLYLKCLKKSIKKIFYTTVNKRDMKAHYFLDIQMTFDSARVRGKLIKDILTSGTCELNQVTWKYYIKVIMIKSKKQSLKLLFCKQSSRLFIAY